MDQASGLDRLLIVSLGGRERTPHPSVLFSAAASGDLCWELGKEVGCYTGVEVGVEATALSPREASTLLGTWDAGLPRQFSCPLARVCLDPLFLCLL